MSYLQINNRKLYYVVLGKGKPVLLLHSLGGSGRDWIYQTEALLITGHQVIIIDMAGHGASTLAASPIPIKDLVKDVWTLLDALNIFKVSIVGVSLGGLVALIAASQRSQRVEKAVLINTFIDTTSPEFTKGAAEWMSQLRDEQGMIDWFEASWPTLVNGVFAKSAKGCQSYQLYHAQASQNVGSSIANVLEGCLGTDMHERLNGIKVPVLLLGGELDMSSIIMQTITEKLPSAKYVSIAGAKHLAQIDSADVVNEHIIKFLKA
ncbi:alpha/beta fold hydrolase [Mucilaginibacter pallidiroseus]|nr:alpha/beta hydrolase [Mucilaginibacter pallidiroseus]